MSWVRIHDGAFTHPKLVGLSDKAFRLWVWGLCYCQMHLTDGMIPLAAMPDRLEKSAGELQSARLWERQVGSIQVHDYLEWNDSKEQVKERQQKSKRRMEQWRGVKGKNRPSGNGTGGPGYAVTNGVTNGVCNAVTNAVPNQTKPNVQKAPSDLFVQRDLASLALSTRVRAKPERESESDFEDEISERAGRFLQKYQELYQEHRKGARCRLLGNALEFQEACALVRVWTDDDRLEKLAIIVLTTDDDFISKTDRNFKIFAMKATWADDRLKQWEMKHGVVA